MSAAKQVTEFLSKNNFLDPNQSGFKSGHSTETALLSVTEALKTARAAQSSALVLLDLSAAFDTVNHRILLSILSSMGISGNAHSWFESCLPGRSFNVAWQGQLSVPHRLTTGVPQGSVMGPLLSAIYTTSLGPIIRSHGFSYHCYADDTQLFLYFPPEDTTVSARISHCLADISTCMKNHHLQLNLAKTELMIFPANRSSTRTSRSILTLYLLLHPKQQETSRSLLMTNGPSRPTSPLSPGRAALRYTTSAKSGRTVPNPVCHPAAGANLGEFPP